MMPTQLELDVYIFSFIYFRPKIWSTMSLSLESWFEYQCLENAQYHIDFCCTFPDGERKEITMAEHTNTGWEIISIFSLQQELLHICTHCKPSLLHSTDCSQLMGEELGRGWLFPNRSWCKWVWDWGVCDRCVGQSYHGRHAQPSRTPQVEISSERLAVWFKSQSGLLQVC